MVLSHLLLPSLWPGSQSKCQKKGISPPSLPSIPFPTGLILAHPPTNLNWTRWEAGPALAGAGGRLEGMQSGCLDQGNQEQLFREELTHSTHRLWSETISKQETKIRKLASLPITKNMGMSPGLFHTQFPQDLTYSPTMSIGTQDPKSYGKPVWISYKYFNVIYSCQKH